MLTRPNHGWSEATIGDFTASAGYLTDIPFEWLRACISSLKYNIPLSLFIDEEGSACFVVSYYDKTYAIIGDEDEPELKVINDISHFDITGMLISYIKAYFEDWVNWYAFDKETENTDRRTELTELLREAEELLNRQI